MTTATAPYLGMPQQAIPAPQQASQFQIPPAPSEVQSIELDEDRWVHMRAMLHGCAAKLAVFLDSEAGLSMTDGLRYEDGSPNMDFEESAIELLGKIERESAEMNQVAGRMRWNLQIRSHEPLAQEPETQQQSA